MLIIGHRGASAQRPENTLAAMRLAEEVSDGFECDIQLLADGTVVVLHDDTLYRTAGGRGWMRFLWPRWFAILRTPASALTWEDVKNVDVGSYFDSAFANERVPLFAEALEVSTKHCFAELKETNSPGDLADAALAVAASSTTITWISFCLEILIRLKNKDPSRRAYYISQSHTEKEAMDAAHIVVNNNLDGLDINADTQVVTKALVDYLHSNGKHIALWVNRAPADNDTQVIREHMANIGVDFFTSNLPP